VGLYDRDYYREPPRGGIGMVGALSVTTWLIVINVVVFFLDRFLWAAQVQQALHQGLPRPPIGPLMQAGYFSIDTAIARLQLWRMVTSQFLHAGIAHLAMNMLGLYIFGGLVEVALGKRRYLFFYLLCGMAGTLMFAVLWAIGILFPNHLTSIFPEKASVMLIGASGAIFGVLVAAAYLSPDRMIDLYFFDLPLRHFAWVMVAVALYTVLMHGPNAGGQAAHLGGALLGWVLIRNEAVLNMAGKRPLNGPRRRTKDWSRDMNR
jgi:membrane associated rhomboid family serine protease